jgi:hypothetical protein
LYSKAIAFGNYFMLEKLVEAEKNSDRKGKKVNIYKAKTDLLLQTYLEERDAITSNSRESKVTNFKKTLNEEQRKVFLIDLAFSNPLAPYVLKYKRKDFNKALHYIGSLIHAAKEDVDAIIKLQKQVLTSQNRIDILKVGLYGVGGIILFGVAGWAVAPVTGTYIGTAAGLTGIAATLHGLALLGGGKLAMGGAGVAGSTWLITGVSAVAGLGFASASSLIFEIGTALSKIEIYKAQMTFFLSYLSDQNKMGKAEDTITQFEITMQEMKEKKEELLMYNEKKSKSIKYFDETIEALDNAILWMKKELKKVN